MKTKLELPGREFWREYLDDLPGGHVAWLVRKAAWEDLLEQVYDEGYDEGVIDGGRE